MNPRVHAVLVPFLFLAPLHAQGGVYRCAGADGQMVITDRPCANARDLEKTMPHAGAKTAPASAAAAVDPGLVIEWERRRAFYMEQGMSPEDAEARVRSELSARPGPGFGGGARDAPPGPPHGPKTGHDNVRDYLQKREQEKAAQRAEHQRWLERSDALDREREEDALRQAAQQRRADCEERRRVQELRQGYSSLDCRSVP